MAAENISLTYGEAKQLVKNGTSVIFIRDTKTQETIATLADFFRQYPNGAGVAPKITSSESDVAAHN